MSVCKILTFAQWAEMQTHERFHGSDDDRRDGFIHLSSPHQVDGTIAKHFAQAGELVVLTIDTHLLGEALRWEESRGGALFPHLYAPLELSAVRDVQVRDRVADCPAAD